MLTDIPFFCPYLPRSKKREEGKNRRKSNYEIKDELLKSLIDGEIEFKFE